MRKCFVKFLFFLVALAALTQGTPAARAAHDYAPLRNARLQASALIKIGHGCGWDYPCPPRPDYGRHVHSQVNINNYGRVNVYTDGYVHRRYPPPCSYYPCGRPAEIDIAPYDLPPYYDESDYRPAYRPCGNDPCREECGPHCWYERLKDGYCGHGCEFYRRKVRFEPRVKEIVVPKPVEYREVPAPPSPPVYYKKVVPEHKGGYGQEPHPLRKYQGPKYPPE